LSCLKLDGLHIRGSRKRALLTTMVEMEMG
jgi:hypothetical protein